MSFGGFPSNLGYHVSKLENYAKQPIKFWSNRGTQTINHGDTIRFSLPKNSLIDLRSLSMYYKGTAAGTGKDNTATYEYCNRFFPRLSASIIHSLSIYTNGGQLIQTIDEYGLLYNIFHDINGGNKDGKTLENTDPSVTYTMLANGNITTRKSTAKSVASAPATDDGDKSDTNRQFCINTWLGFLNGTTEFFDTNNAELEIEIRLAPEYILWNSAPPAGTIGTTPASYTLNSVYMTCDRVNFHDPLYYNIISQKLSSTGLEVGFDSYSLHVGSTAANKKIDMSFSVNARNLSMLLCTGTITTRSSMTTTANYLELEDSGQAAGKTYDEVISNLGGTATDHEGIAFNQSKYFRRTGAGIKSSQIEVNSIATSPWPLEPHEIFNQNLINFNQQSNMMTQIHKGCASLNHFMRDYFIHTVSFEHRGSPSDMQVGLDGKASSIDVKWTTTSDGGANACIPMVFAVKKEILLIGAGHQTSLLR